MSIGHGVPATVDEILIVLFDRLSSNMNASFLVTLMVTLNSSLLSTLATKMLIFDVALFNTSSRR